ncbi:hypothetical protein [Streptomyces mirabilis]|uniref:hypothetical protein n=1 Tax=Streptomyces mirabilis TaxID=68239 RepID=UPI003691D33F
MPVARPARRCALFLPGLLLLTACGGGSSADGGKSPKPTGAVSLDTCGRKVTIASAPKRTVSLNQGTTEITARIGSRLCGFGTAGRRSGKRVPYGSPISWWRPRRAAVASAPGSSTYFCCPPWTTGPGQ